MGEVELASRQTRPSGCDGLVVEEEVEVEVVEVEEATAAALGGRRVRASVPSPPPDSSRSPFMDTHAT